MKVYLADNQDITRAGLTYLLSGMDVKDTKYTEDKAELIAALRSDSKAVVVLDYTLFDINDANELSILCQRFPSTWWVLFSDDLSQDFIHQVALTCPTCGIVLKECDTELAEDVLAMGVDGVEAREALGRNLTRRHAQGNVLEYLQLRLRQVGTLHRRLLLRREHLLHHLLADRFL